MGKNQWVVKKDGQWGVGGEGNSRVTAYYETQKEAIDAARAIAKNQQSELIVQGNNNKIRIKDSYGNDDCPPKG